MWEILENKKNHVFLIHLLESLIKESTDYRLVLIGEGELKEEIHKLVSSLELDPYVVFLGSISNVNEWLNAFDVFVFPSLYEGFGIALEEALCSGLPCIVSKHVSFHLSMDEESLKFLSLEDKDAWIKSIRKTLLNCKRKQLNENNLSQMDIKEYVEKLESYYDFILNDLE